MHFLTFLIFGFLSALGASPHWLLPLESSWKLQNPGKPYSFQKVSDLRRHQTDSVRFEIRKGETWIDDEKLPSFRTEVNTWKHFPMESEKWYGFSIFLPKDFPIENNRLVIAQWWALTKSKLGEVHRSPPLQLRFADGRLSIRLRTYDAKVVKDPSSYQEKKLYEIKKFPLGEWNDFVVHVKWSFTEKGFINAWWNGKQIISYQGRTTNDDEVGPKFKFGLYRDDTEKTYISYMSEVRIGDSRDEVDPAKKR